MKCQSTTARDRSGRRGTLATKTVGARGRTEQPNINTVLCLDPRKKRRQNESREHGGGSSESEKNGEDSDMARKKANESDGQEEEEVKERKGKAMAGEKKKIWNK